MSRTVVEVFQRWSRVVGTRCFVLRRSRILCRIGDRISCLMLFVVFLNLSNQIRPRLLLSIYFTILYHILRLQVVTGSLNKPQMSTAKFWHCRYRPLRVLASLGDIRHLLGILWQKSQFVTRPVCTDRTVTVCLSNNGTHTWMRLGKLLCLFNSNEDIFGCFTDCVFIFLQNLLPLFRTSLFINCR